jgi:hypothetical protein
MSCIYERFLIKRIFQYHSIFEYFIKSNQTRQALKLLLVGGIFWTFYLAFAALLQCFMHQIYTWTFVRQITLVALYKLKPLQNLTWGNIFSPASDGSSLYTITNIEVVYLLYHSVPPLWYISCHLLILRLKYNPSVYEYPDIRINAYDLW